MRPVARPQSVDDDQLLGRLAGVFRDVGYEGASLAKLSGAAGLRKASLYHRFPGGKRAMAEEVLAGALGWMTANVIAPLSAEGAPRDRVALAAARLDGFYEGGNRACLLNMLAAPRVADGPFSPAIRGAYALLIDAFARPAADAGLGAVEARARAERAVVMLQGSLVLARGMGDPAPFRTYLAGLPALLLD